MPDSRYSFPNKELTSKLKATLDKRKSENILAAGWTIDAPYRETTPEIQEYRKEGIETVEMESSALFAVAEFRGVEIASAFAISDLLKDGMHNFIAPGSRKTYAS